MEEVWKPIPELEFYEASSLGRVRSIDRIVQNSRYGDMKLGSKLLSDRCINDSGYICHNIHTISRRAHRLICAAFHPNPNNYSDVNHIDGIKLNNLPENLEWCTRQYNQIHAIALGLKKNEAQRGERHNLTHLEEKDVIEIRRLYSLGNITYREIGERYSMVRSSIMKIIKRTTWKHI